MTASTGRISNRAKRLLFVAVTTTGVVLHTAALIAVVNTRDTTPMLYVFALDLLVLLVGGLWKVSRRIWPDELRREVARAAEEMEER